MFLYMLEELSVNISLVEALEKMSSYAKFIKDLLTRKWTIIVQPADNLHHYSFLLPGLWLKRRKIQEPSSFHALLVPMIFHGPYVT